MKHNVHVEYELKAYSSYISLKWSLFDLIEIIAKWCVTEKNYSDISHEIGYSKIVIVTEVDLESHFFSIAVPALTTIITVK